MYILHYDYIKDSFLCIQTLLKKENIDFWLKFTEERNKFILRHIAKVLSHSHRRSALAFVKVAIPESNHSSSKVFSLELAVFYVYFLFFILASRKHMKTSESVSRRNTVVRLILNFYIFETSFWKLFFLPFKNLILHIKNFIFKSSFYINRYIF